MKLSAWLAERRSSGTGTSQAMDWLVVGLGNPGPRYADTRHNAGRMVVAELARRHAVELGSVKFNARFGSVRIGDVRVMLAMPLCYMNESGQAVAPLARFYQIPPERILAVYDDLDLPLGRLRLRADGGAGGHNGVSSLIRSLGTPTFPRLRLGIDRPPAGWDGADYVLGRFTKDERELIDSRLPDAADAIERTVREGVLAAMNVVNGRDEAKAGAKT
jgi:PTH1 family peptidyl-tRNA hydrolase